MGWALQLGAEHDGAIAVVDQHAVLELQAQGLGRDQDRVAFGQVDPLIVRLVDFRRRERRLGALAPAGRPLRVVTR